MATTIFQEAGSNATGGLEFYTSTTGTVATDTVVSRLSDPRSIKCTCDGSGNPSYAEKDSIMADAGRRMSQHYYFDTLPDNAADATTGRAIWSLRTAAAASVFGVALRSTGVLTITGGGTFKAGTNPISAAVFTRISVSYVITNTTTFTIKVYVNGNIEITATGADFTLAATTGVHVRIGWPIAVAAGMANKVCHFSDVYVDNGTDLEDVCQSGTQRGVTWKAPTAVNTGGYDTTIGTGAVNEVPISLTNGMEELATSNVQQNYNLQGPTAGNRDISNATIVSRTAWMWAKATTGSSGTPKIMDNGTETAVVLTTSPALYTVITDGTVYPTNAAGIGQRSNGTSAGTFLYECGTIIAYDAPIVPKNVPQPLVRLPGSRLLTGTGPFLGRPATFPPAGVVNERFIDQIIQHPLLRFRIGKRRGPVILAQYSTGEGAIEYLQWMKRPRGDFYDPDPQPDGRTKWFPAIP